MASPIGKQEVNSCLWEHRHGNIWLKLTLDSVNKQDDADWLSESYEEKWCTDTHSQHKHSLLADCWHWNAINSNSLKWSELGCFNRILIRLTLFTFASLEMSNKCHWLELQLSLMKAVDKTAPPVGVESTRYWFIRGGVFSCVRYLNCRFQMWSLPTSRGWDWNMNCIWLLLQCYSIIYKARLISRPDAAAVLPPFNCSLPVCYIKWLSGAAWWHCFYGFSANKVVLELNMQPLVLVQR